MRYIYTITKGEIKLRKAGKIIHTCSLSIAPCFVEYFPTGGNYFLTPSH